MATLIRNLLPTLAAKIAGGLVVALLIALAVSRMQLGAAHDREAELTKAIGILNQAIGTLRANQATLQAGIAAQNTALQRAEAAGAARTASLEQSLSAARRTAQTAREQANAVLSRRPGADQCADALQLIRGN